MPAEPLHDSVDVPELPNATLGGDNVQVSPAGETADVRLTVPASPF